jgi:hypothetical protein
MHDLVPDHGLYIEDLSVKLSDSHARRFWPKVGVRGLDECWPWKGYTDPGGYGQFSVGGKTKGAHRIAARFTGEDPTGKVVRHVCHNPSCVNPRHLKVGTQKENMQDMLRAGRQARGEQSGTSKLSADQVRVIRASDRSPKELAKEYPTSASNIRSIRARETWDHLQ